MLGEVLKAFDLPPEFWASLVGCSEEQFHEWTSSQRELPLSLARRFSSLTGIDAGTLLRRPKGNEDPLSLIPPLWLKAREENLSEGARKAIAIAQLVGSKYTEIAELTDSQSDAYKNLFADIKTRHDLRSPARKQGESSALAFLSLSGLGTGARGIGEVLRGHLRARGVLVLEMSIVSRDVEGFCLPIGSRAGSRPCLIANGYRATWFRRNFVILHELAHAIFDLDGSGATFDVGADAEAGDSLKSLAEERANSFAQHVLVPKRMLVNLESTGLRLLGANKESLAQIVAASHAEQRTIVRAALEYGLIDEAEARRLLDLDIASDLRRVSDHAKDLSSTPPGYVIDQDFRRWKNRETSFPIEGIRLPIPFVSMVVSAFRDQKISYGKAADLLMATDEELSSQYGLEPEFAT